MAEALREAVVELHLDLEADVEVVARQEPEDRVGSHLLAVVARVLPDFDELIEEPRGNLGAAVRERAERSLS